MALSPEIITTLIITTITIALFLRDNFRIDVSALIILCLLALSRFLPGIEPLLDYDKLLGGFSSNAVLAIIASMIIGTGLDNTGTLKPIANSLCRTDGGAVKISASVSGYVGLISGFMQNIGAAALFIPVIRRICQNTGITPSQLYMPMGFATILGGTLTMIGSSPLIILNDLMPAQTKPFDLFDVSPIGLALLLGGIAYFAIVGHKLLPEPSGGSATSANSRANHLYGVNTDIHILLVGANFPMADRLAGEIEQKFNIDIVGLHHRDLVVSPHRDIVIPAGCHLAVVGNASAVELFKTQKGICEDKDNVISEAIAPTSAGWSQILIPPGSSLAGKRIRDIRIRRSYGITPLAIMRATNTILQNLREQRLQVGDAIYGYIRWQDLQRLASNPDFAIVDHKFPKESERPEKRPFAISAFVLSLLLAAFTNIPISQALLIGAVIMIISGVVNIDEAYRAVSWQTVFLVTALIPLGLAMEHTGTANWISVHISQLLGGNLSLLQLQIMAAVLATLFTLIMSNVGATILLVPMLANMTIHAGYDPRSVCLVVALCVSNAFLIPTHQVNALLMGPGGYTTKDYLRVGSGMSIVFIFITIAMMQLINY